MSTSSKIGRAFLFSLVIGAVSVFPVGATGVANTGQVAVAECMDCQWNERICCGDCSSKSQEQKCTVGEWWCPL